MKTQALVASLIISSGLLSACGLHFDSPPRTNAVALADLDGDGDLDAVVGNAGGEIGVLDHVWWNDGTGAFMDSGQPLDKLQTHTIETGDFDSDGDADVLWGRDGYTRLFTNDGAGQLRSVQSMLASTIGGFHNAVAAGDLDGDGDLDAFVGNLSSLRDAQGTTSRNEPETIWLNDGTGHLADSGQRLGHSETFAVALGDLDRDGDLDAFVGNSGADEVWLNDGSGNFSDSGQALGNTHTRHAALGDLDGDGDLDAVVDTERGGAVWRNDGTGNFTADKQGLSHASDCAITLGEVDGDGDLDIVAGCVDPGMLVWLNDGTGNFESTQ